jgi:beta-N-acetylhexosaminidase
MAWLSSLVAQTPGAKVQALRLTAAHDEAERWAEETLKTLPLEGKVAQMICEQMRGEYIPEDSERFQYWVRLARDYGIGGFVVYGGSPIETAHLLNRLQKEAKLPLLISADFEGGPGQQFAGATEFPGNMALSAAGSEDLAYQEGKVGAREGRAIGIHVTYSPSVDIQTRADNPVMSVRSFGADLEMLGRLAGAYIRGYQENGMLATAKHFPGRGDVELIPGTEFTINRKPAEQVEREDILAFKKAIDAGVAFVMSEHIAVPSLTNGSDLPASVDRTLATVWLREKLGFTGVLTSDDLWYEKMTKRFGAVKAGILAVQAGHDVLLKPADAIEMIQGVVRSVRSGDIAEARIDQSVRRILYWKARLNLHRNRFVDESRIAAVVGAREHRQVLRAIADQSLTLLINRQFFPTTSQKIGSIAHVVIQKSDHEPAAVIVADKLKDAFRVNRTIVIRPGADSAQYYEALRAVSVADTVVLSVFSQRTAYKDNGPLRDRDWHLVADIVRIKPRSTVVMSYGNPYVVEGLKDTAAFVVGYGEGGFYGNQTVFADAFIRLLKGEIVPRGKLPVAVSKQFPIGSGLTYGATVNR